MTVTMEQVRSQLDSDEPDYAQAAGLGPEALPHLEELSKGEDLMLASKAVYLTGLVQHERSASVLAEAASSDDPRLRVAAASAAGHLAADSASDVLLPLVADDDQGVRRVALKAVPAQPKPELRSTIEDLRTSDPDEAIRNLSQETLQRLSD